jgi:hypothetical protein
MIQGIVERRIGPRVACRPSLKIRLARSGEPPVTATGSNISPGGLEFYVPFGACDLCPGEMVRFQFDLPELGSAVIQGEVRHVRYCTDSRRHAVNYFGVKFLDLTHQARERISDYCRAHSGAEAAPPVPDTCRSGPEPAPDRPIRRLSARVQPQDGALASCEIDDVSFGGIRIILASPLALESTVRIIPAVDARVRFDLSGTCIWCGQRPAGDPGYLAGIFFDRLSPAEFRQVKALLAKAASL